MVISRVKTLIHLFIARYTNSNTIVIHPSYLKWFNPEIFFYFFIFLTFRQLILDMGVLIRLIGSPDCDFMKIAMGEVYFQGTWKNPLLGAWMTFKKAIRTKPLGMG